MPQKWYTSWKNIDRIVEGNALDAKYWNTLVAPNNNLDYISEFRNQSDAVLALNLNTTSIPNNTYTTINWTNAVYEYDPGMWDSAFPSTISLTMGARPPLVGVWVVTVFAAWSAGGAFSAKSLYFNNQVIDMYGENNNNVVHQYSFPIMTYINNTESLTLSVIQATGAAINFSALLYLQRIPSAISLYYPENYGI